MIMQGVDTRRLPSALDRLHRSRFVTQLDLIFVRMCSDAM